MNSILARIALLLVVFSATCVGCKRSSDDVWNDTKSASRHISRGFSTLVGNHGESRQVRSTGEFFGDGEYYASDANSPDYIAFEDENPSPDMRTRDGKPIGAPNQTPGESGSAIPGIEAFKDPAEDPQLAEIFKHVHFEYNSSLIKGDENYAILQSIADYLNSHPAIFIFVEGHCDKRGPAAYNFALGANRSNSVRNILVKQGVLQDRIFTVSYGKDKPLVDGDGEEYYRLNRRSQFKIYEQN